MFQKNSRTIPVQIEDLTFCGHSTSNKTPEFFCCKKSAMSSVHKRNFLTLLLKKIRNEFSSNRKSSALTASKTNLGAVQFIETILQLCCFNFFWDEFSSNKKSYDLLVSKKIRDEFSSETRNLITLFCHNKSGTNSVQTDIL